jgi:hypothetical protein
MFGRFSTVWDLPGSKVAITELEDLPRESVHIELDGKGEPKRVDGTPFMTLPADTTISQLMRSAAGTLLQHGIEAIVLRHADKIVGVVSKAALDKHLKQHGILLFADSGLDGNPITPVPTVICAMCGFANQVRNFDPANPPKCQNPNPPPHLLKLM